MLRSRRACWMADRSIYKRLFYTTGGLALERVERRHIKLLEIPFISGRNNQTMYPRCSGNHGVLQQTRLPVVHNSGTFPKTRRIHGEHRVGRGQQVSPALDFFRLAWVLASGLLNPNL